MGMVTSPSLLLIIGVLQIFCAIEAVARPSIDWSFSYNFDHTGFAINDVEMINQDNIVFVASTNNYHTLEDYTQSILPFDKVFINEGYEHCLESAYTCDGFVEGIVVGFANSATNQVNKLYFIAATHSIGAYDLELDTFGNIYIVGETWRHQMSGSEKHFPVKNPLPSHNDFTYYEPGYVNKGMTDGFVIKLTNNGELALASYFGGNGKERINSVTVNDYGFAISGYTDSSDFYLASTGIEYSGGSDGFLTVIDHAYQIPFSTYVGGSGKDSVLSVDTYKSEVLFGGYTTSTDLSVSEDAKDKVLSGSVDGLLGIYNYENNEISYLSYFGGQNSEGISKVIYRDDKHLYLGGTSNSPELSQDSQTINYLGPFVAQINRSTFAIENLWSYSHKGVYVSLGDMSVSPQGKVAIAGNCEDESRCSISFIPHINMLEETSDYEKKAHDSGYVNANFSFPSLVITWDADENVSEPWMASFLPSSQDHLSNIKFNSNNSVLISGFTYGSNYVDNTYSVRDSDGYVFGGFIMEIDLGMVKNKTPTLVDDTITVEVDGEIVFYPMSNDYDEDGYIIEHYFDTNGPKHGSKSGSAADGGYRYVPDVGYEGPDSFIYRVRDNAGEWASATVKIRVGKPEKSGGGSVPMWILFTLVAYLSLRKYRS